MNEDELTVDVTEKAADEVHALLDERDMGDHGVSVAVDYAGGEATYTLEFAEEPADTDIVVETRGVEVYVDNDSAAAVDNCTIDYVVQDGRAGFEVQTPEITAGDDYDDGLEGRVREFLARNFPQIEGHGGEAIIEELDKTDGYVRMSLEGACGGCGISDATTSAIQKKLPQNVEGIRKVDVSAGDDDGGMEIESPF